MKKRLAPANAPLPKFRSDEEAADYFETHSVSEVWNKLPAARRVMLSKEMSDSIRERHTAAKSPIPNRLGADQITAAKKISAAKSIGYQTQLRIWIAEGIRREARRK
jgi:predicted DNA binding CopG/RHH family protein